MPGTYTVALMSGGKTLDSKSVKVVFDPDVHFAAGEHERYTAILNDLHALQRRGVAAAGALNALYPGMTDAAKKVSENSSLSPATKTQFETLNKEFDAVRKKFGVPLNAGAAGGRGGGGGRGGAVDPDNILGKESSLKTQLMSIWEAPSASMVKEYTEMKLALPKAVAEANAVLAKAAAMSKTLSGNGITLTVPPTVK
jgi:hypothetical protein